MHNLEPRGYVVGWIIAISLLVGILIFLLLAVLLWKVSLVIQVPREPPPVDAQPSCLARVRDSLEEHPCRNFLYGTGTAWGGQSPLRVVNAILDPFEALHSQGLNYFRGRIIPLFSCLPTTPSLGRWEPNSKTEGWGVTAGTRWFTIYLEKNKQTNQRRTYRTTLFLPHVECEKDSCPENSGNGDGLHESCLGAAP